jgi:uncharacterized NAD-dependent epimerase/dehydratase family protein
MMKHQNDGNAVIYCQGAFATTNGKTAHGLVRRTDRYRVLSVIDSRYAGKDAGAILDGKKKDIPVYENLEAALKAAEQKGIPLTHFVMGLAPDGGRLSNEAREDVKEAIRLGLNVDSGLHDILSEDPVFSELAAKHNVRIRDIRKVPPRSELHFFTGKIEEVKSLKIAVLGTDSALGKRTTAWILLDAFMDAGLSVELIGTGQTAWMQGARYSTIIDSLIVDFVTGEIEHAVWQAWHDTKPDVILIEGQGSLLNPAYPGGIEILSAGRPDVIVVQHAPGRKEYDGFPGYTLHPINLQIKALEIVSGKPVGVITLNHEHMKEGEIEQECNRISKETGLPTADVLISGANQIAAHLVRYNKEVFRKYRKKLQEHRSWGGQLNNLVVIDKLEVGPIQIERDRVIAPYSIHSAGVVDSIDFIYRFEEEMFQQEDKASQNIASMMAAQVVLNYGLFCKQIVFHGAFDGVDQRFIRYMMRNTAREIYVKKLLEPNPFLIPEFHAMQLEQRSSYVQAELLFPESALEELYTWETDRKRCAVLSSGGKESLLSFGLMNEIGIEPTPVFINESGRHWYTALNSYRAFKSTRPRTARVWTNSDRVFSWMLEHIPFIKQNFLNIRADDYPLRLWTVAVFLFGALPVLRKRGIGLLLIGDEYDTTRRCRYEGIPHFDGLFDQSRYFDLALSGYFACKGWHVDQLSILRPLSEILVQKILTERYPELQRNQTSCHAVSIKNNQVQPCGKCEKCHRIVGMLASLDADPTLCSYTPEQVAACLRALPQRSLHQESATSEHVLNILRKKGMIEGGEGARPHPEVERLRFDHEHSPVETIPREIREPLLNIYQQHVNGAIRLIEGEWQSFDPIRV